MRYKTMRIEKEKLADISARTATLNYQNLRRRYSAATPADGITIKTLAHNCVIANDADTKRAAAMAFDDFIKDLEHRSRNNNKLAGAERR